MNSSNNPRLRGVGQPPVRGEEGAPRTLLHVQKAEMFGVEFNDEVGRKQTGICIRVGDQLYWPPNAIEWAGQLKPAAGWFKEQFAVRAGALTADNADVQAEDLPKEDAVDVLGGTDGTAPVARKASAKK